MSQILIFFLGFLIGGIVIWLLSKPKKSKNPSFEEAEKNRGKVREYLRSRDRISNDEVEELLGVSDSTATRYLDDLEKEGLIRQIGKTGRHVYYEKL